MPVLDHFSLLAPLYEKFIPPPRAVDWQTLLRLPIGGKILDAAGGTGRVAQLLTGSAGTVVVLDVSLRMLGEACLKGGLVPTGGTGENLPFREGAFERILMVDAFHHLANQRQCAVELWRVLQPGGRLVIEEPDIDSFLVKGIALGEKLFLMRSHFWRAEKIAGLFGGLPAVVQVIRHSNAVWVIVDRQTAD
jgi:ubiquinone/menaquinone biosynthesis C-methylase UbiE